MSCQTEQAIVVPDMNVPSAVEVLFVAAEKVMSQNSVVGVAQAWKESGTVIVNGIDSE